MKTTFPILSHVEGDLFVKHTYGNVRKLVKAILKLSELPHNSAAYQRHLNRMWTSVDALERSFKAQKRHDTHNKKMVVGAAMHRLVVDVFLTGGSQVFDS